MRWGAFIAAAVVGMTASAAHAACKVPADVDAYLSKNKDWKVVEEAALNADDRKLWAADHAGQCPGIAGADIKGNGKPVYVVTLLKTTGAETQQKLVLVDPQGSPKTLKEPWVSGAPAVVWVTGPGEQEEFETHRIVKTKNPAFVLEQMEASMMLYYYEGGQVRSLVLSD